MGSDWQGAGHERRPEHRPVRIGNCSGFYGDRLAAMREMLTGGDLDYLTGDYLAELTMLILARDRAKSPERGYAKTFLTPARGLPGHWRWTAACKIVANAGGLNPAGLAAAVRALADRLGLAVNVAHVEGDDLRRAGRRARASALRWPPTPTSARGASSTACDAGADVVVTGRVTDASVIVGPAAAHFGWAPHRLRRPGRRGGRGPRHRVRHAGHRRQLCVLHRDRRPHPSGLPARRDPCRRIVGDHQASGHRRRWSPSTPSPPSCSTRSAARATPIPT